MSKMQHQKEDTASTTIKIYDVSSYQIANTETNTLRHLLGFRKPSLLSITSLLSPNQSNSTTTAARNAGRTFSLDDLFRSPKSKSIVTFSIHVKKGNKQNVISFHVLVVYVNELTTKKTLFI